MLDLFLKLIDRLIKLAETNEKNRRQLYTDFVAPAMADFETVHNDYLESFRRYRELLTDTSTPPDDSHPVFETILHDGIMTDGARFKLFELYHQQLQNEELKPLLRSMLDYLYGAEQQQELPPLIRNRELFHPEICSYGKIRTQLRRDLWSVIDTESECLEIQYPHYMPKRVYRISCRKPGEIKRIAMIGKLLNSLKTLDERYQIVVHEHTKLKCALLNP